MAQVHRSSKGKALSSTPNRKNEKKMTQNFWTKF
jgi:hypothetical protein